MINDDIFLTFAPNIDFRCFYDLSQNKKNKVYPYEPHFSPYIVRFLGLFDYTDLWK